MNPYSLLTDFYELTMMGGYFEQGRHQEEACFEYYFRRLPGQAGFAVFCGIEAFAREVMDLAFGQNEMDYLSEMNVFKSDFLEALSEFRFRGNVDAALEGSVVFPYEPLVVVQGKLWEVQIIETFLLNCLNYPTLVATKAARVCQAAQGDPVLEFGLRRAQGRDGGITGSRAAYVGGCAGSSNVEAGRRFGIPVKGTHAHSWVMSFPDELSAFRAYVDVYPDSPILLVDSYDTIESGVPHAVQVFQERKRQGWTGRPGIRLDSGDLVQQSQEALRLFQEAGFEDPLIVASNDLDEYAIEELKSSGAKINCWGVGTQLIVSGDCPALGGVYKLCAVKPEFTWTPVIKVSEEPAKVTDPGRKAVSRLYRDGTPIADLLHRWGESPETDEHWMGVARDDLTEAKTFPADLEARPLLKPMLRQGKRVARPRDLEEIRQFAQQEINSLSRAQQRLRDASSYPVLLHPHLAEIKNDLLAQHASQDG